MTINKCLSINLKKLCLLLLLTSVFSCKNASEKKDNELITTEIDTVAVKKEVIEVQLSEEEKQRKKHFDSIDNTRFFNSKGMVVHHMDTGFIKKDFYHIYGKERIKDTVIYSFDGMDVIGTEITFENSVDNFSIEWNEQNDLESTIQTIRIANKNANWKTSSGIGMGSSIEEVEAVNGKPFSIYGFEINNYISGMSKNWEDGNLDNISLRFAPSNTIDPQVYAQIRGKNGILSNDPLLKDAGLVVDFIAIHFQECNEGVYSTEFCITQLDFLPPEPKENLRGEDWIKVNLWNNTKEVDVYFVQNSILYDYGSHVVKQSPQVFDASVLTFTVYNRVTQKKYELGYEDFGYFFEGVVNNLIIIDSGTGSSREFILYDIETGKLVYQAGYYNSITIEGDEIIFEDVVTLTEDQKPVCPQKIIDLKYYGFVEKYTYNTKTKKFNATGIYRCEYME